MLIAHLFWGHRPSPYELSFVARQVLCHQMFLDNRRYDRLIEQSYPVRPVSLVDIGIAPNDASARSH